MIDTHAHLDALADPPGDVLARARDAGVTRVIAVGSDVASWRTALALAEEEDGVYAAVGIHPHQAGDAEQADVAQLMVFVDQSRVVAVGETGLDYFRNYAPRDRQLALFRVHVELARESRKALVVHSRAADEDTVSVLRDAADEVPVILHCFSSVALLEPALQHGWYVSFAGNVTYPKATDLRWAATHVPADRILVETDSPYLAPQPVRGRPNEPAHVVHTLGALADARGEDAAELEERIETNAAAAFGLAQEGAIVG